VIDELVKGKVFESEMNLRIIMECLPIDNIFYRFIIKYSECVRMK